MPVEDELTEGGMPLKVFRTRVKDWAEWDAEHRGSGKPPAGASTGKPDEDEEFWKHVEDYPIGRPDPQAAEDEEDQRILPVGTRVGEESFPKDVEDIDLFPWRSDSDKNKPPKDVEDIDLFPWRHRKKGFFRTSVKYDDSEARDDHGRWTTGGSGSAPLFRKPPGAAGVSAATRRVVEAENEREMAGKHNPGSLTGVKDWTKATPAQVEATESERAFNTPWGIAAAKQLANDNTRVVYYKGENKVVFDKTVPAAKQKMVMDTLDTLDAEYPKAGGRTILVGRDANKVAGRLPAGTGGVTDKMGGHLIGLTTATVKLSDDEMHHMASTLEGPKIVGRHGPAGFAEQAAADPNVHPIQYILTHEFGHSMDDPAAEGSRTVGEYVDAHNLATQGAFRTTQAGSQYGETDPSEAFAEAFAEWNLSKGKTTDPQSIALARAQGWNKFGRDYPALSAPRTLTDRLNDLPDDDSVGALD